MIRRFFAAVFPRNTDNIVTITGLGGSGKTTLLYLLKLGAPPNVVSPLSFNVELVRAPTATGRNLSLLAWGIGANSIDDKLSSIIHGYAALGDALLWMVDSSCGEAGVQQSMEAFTSILERIDVQRLEEGNTPKDFPILMYLLYLLFPADCFNAIHRLANKQDIAKAVPIDNVRKAFAQPLAGRASCILGSSLAKGIDKGGLPDAFSWLQFALEKAKKSHTHSRSPRQGRSLIRPYHSSMKSILGCGVSKATQTRICS
jgi:hypothetical protein